jgi:hypothetical protein
MVLKKLSYPLMPKSVLMQLVRMVGAAGFEPATPSPQSASDPWRSGFFDTKINRVIRKLGLDFRTHVVSANFADCCPNCCSDRVLWVQGMEEMSDNYLIYFSFPGRIRTSDLTDNSRLLYR